jgi:hypothetical protein
MKRLIQLKLEQAKIRVFEAEEICLYRNYIYFNVCTHSIWTKDCRFLEEICVCVSYARWYNYEVLTSSQHKSYCYGDGLTVSCL